jgi:hypothetical protein
MRTRSMLMNVCMISVAAFILACAPLRGDTIASVAGSSDGNDTLSGTYEVLEVSFTTTQAYQDVSIDTTLSATGGFDPNVTAYLTTQIGPSTNSALATSPLINVSDTTPEVYTLFSSLDLGAGTYYLVLTSDASMFWNSTSAPTSTIGNNLGRGEAVAGGPGTLNTTYAPASTFAPLSDNLLFDVIGTPLAAVPEPSSLASSLLLLGLCGISWRRRGKSLA